MAYVIEDGRKLLQLDDGSRAPVVAPLSLEDGSKTALIPSQLAVLTGMDGRLEALVAATGTSWQRLQAAPDLVQTINYLDPATEDERVGSIAYTSAALALSITENYSYAGGAGSYRLTTITRSS